MTGQFQGEGSTEVGYFRSLVLGHTGILPRITRDVLLNLAGALDYKASPCATHANTLPPSSHQCQDEPFKTDKASVAFFFSFLFSLFPFFYWHDRLTSLFNSGASKPRAGILGSIFFFPDPRIGFVAKAWAPRILPRQGIYGYDPSRL
jgi:hypothetical protein